MRHTFEYDRDEAVWRCSCGVRDEMACHDHIAAYSWWKRHAWECREFVSTSWSKRPWWRVRDSVEAEAAVPKWSVTQDLAFAKAFCPDTYSRVFGEIAAGDEGKSFWSNLHDRLYGKNCGDLPMESVADDVVCGISEAPHPFVTRYWRRLYEDAVTKTYGASTRTTEVDDDPPALPVHLL